MKYTDKYLRTLVMKWGERIQIGRVPTRFRAGCRDSQSEWLWERVRSLIGRVEK